MREFGKKRISLLLLIFTILLISFYLSPTIKNLKKEVNNYSIEDKPKTSGSSPVWEYKDTDDVFSVALSSDGNYIVAGTLSDRVRFFHKTSSTPLWSYTAGDDVLSVSISSDGRYIASGGYDRQVCLFSNTSSIPLWNFWTMAPGWVSKVAISKDGNYIVAGTSVSNNVYAFSRSSSTPLWRSDISDWVEDVGISSDGSKIIVGSRDNRVRCYGISSSTPLWSFTTSGQVLTVGISDDGNFAVAGTDTGWLYFFNTSSSTPLWVKDFVAPFYEINSVDISADGEYITVGVTNDRVYLFHQSSSMELWSYQAANEVTSVAISSNGNYIVAGTEIMERRIYLFEKSSNNPLWNYSGVLHDRIASVAISEDGYYIAAACMDSTLRFFYESYEPRVFTLTSNAESPDTDGLFDLIWTESRLSNNYSVYVYNHFITEINTSHTLLTDGLTSLNHPISLKSNGTYYYIVVAFNQNGNITSNCISVEANLFPPDDFDLSTDADTPDLNGIFNLIWTDSMYADNYSIYFFDKYITEINTSLTILDNQTASSPYLISGLNNGTYYYVIVAFNPFGNTTSNCISIEVKLFPPGSFILSSDADAPDIDGSFNLIWTDSVGADNYSVYVYNSYITEINSSLTILANQTAISPYLVNGLTNGTYYYIIEAYNLTGSRLSNCISIDVKLFPPDDFVLSTDADTPDLNGIFNLIWTDSMYADNYSIYFFDKYITEINTSLTILDNQTASSPYLISGLNNGTYYYVIVAFNPFGNTTSNCISIEVKLFPPGSFILSSDADAPDIDGSFNLIWTDSVGADNYSVYVYNSYITEINSSLTILADQTASSPYPIIENSRIYYYIVVAYNETGYTLSNCISVDIQIPPGPFSLSTDADIPDPDGAFNLIWTDSAGADNYSVYVYNSYITEINTSLTILADQTATSPYPIIENSGIYYYIVVAYNEYGMIRSNCIKIEVNLPSDQSNLIPGYNIFLLIGTISIVSLILMRKQKQ